MSAVELDLESPPKEQYLKYPKIAGENLAAEVARLHGVNLKEMMGPVRYHHLQVARIDLYTRLRAQGWSYPAIGHLMNRDHTTIIQALKGRRA